MYLFELECFFWIYIYIYIYISRSGVSGSYGSSIFKSLLFLCLYFGAELHRLWDFSSRLRIEPRASLVAQMVKNLPAMWETWVQSLGQEDPLEKGMATHSGILTWRIPRTEEPAGLWPNELQRVGHD